jgi:co-chaperonin GroES (HSP10)
MTERLNTSGIEPCGNKVLVKPDSVEEVTEGGIVIPKTVTDRHQLSACYGYVIAVGPDCFQHAVELTERLIDGSWKPIERKTIGYSGEFARPGDRISFAPYGGAHSTGQDGETYWIINDEDITGHVTEGVTQTSIEARKPLAVK